MNFLNIPKYFDCDFSLSENIAIVTYFLLFSDKNYKWVMFNNKWYQYKRNWEFILNYSFDEVSKMLKKTIDQSA